MTVRAKTAAFLGTEESFQATGHAVVDRLLTDKALRLLRRYLQASTIYFYPRAGHHLLALLEDGLASPLLAQLADGLRHAMPSILGPLPLTGARAWKADNSALAVGPSGPELGNSSLDAAVSLLIWTVPASALNGSEMGALRLRGRDPSAELDEVSVKYASNRAVLWGPELEAVWAGPGWKTGFLQRGIHFLLTFGWTRCDA